MDFLDPERVNGKQYQLSRRNDTIPCPKSVERCEQCRIAFCQTDKVIVESVGVREHTYKAGKVVKYLTNVHFHYLKQCLKEYNQNFHFLPLLCLPVLLNFFLKEHKQY